MSKLPKMSSNTSYKISEASKKNKPETRVTNIPDNRAAALKYLSPSTLLTI